MDLDALPLFPLGTVLFPGLGLPLHIFEPRYRQMIADCAAGSGRFGVVGIERGIEVGGGAEPYRVGTLAVITELERLRDGRYTLVAVGLERIRITAFEPAGKPYLRGRAEPWPDAPDPVLPEAAERAGALFQTYLAGLLRSTRQEAEAADPGIDLPQDPAQRAAVIGAILQVPLAERQALLEAPSAGARLAAECRLLARELQLSRTIPAASSPNPAALRGHFSHN